jgi:cell division septation protein DedD
MELNCPRCGSKNEVGEGESRAPACAACGAPLGPARAPRRPADGAPDYDRYAVGRRVLKVAPAWLLLCVAGFLLVLLLFDWAARPAGQADEARDEVFKNEATNRPPSRDARAVGQESKAPTARDGAAGPESGAVEAGAPPPGAADAVGAAQGEFSVQVGAFGDRSRANEQVSRLRAAGFDARVEESGASARVRFQVRSGRFTTREEAARLAAQLRARRLADEAVIVEPAKQQ